MAKSFIERITKYKKDILKTFCTYMVDYHQ
jgi:hypothetical protein